MNSYSSSRRSKRAIGWLVVAVAALTAGVPAGARQVAQKYAGPAGPKLEVKELSGSFTQWGTTAALSDGGLIKDFRWSNTRTDAVTGRYEIAYGLGKSEQKEMILPKPLGASGIFSIDFKPLLAKLTGSPSINKVFHVRVVLLNLRGQALFPPSQTVTVTYYPPAGGTKFDSAMALILKSVKCVDTTSGDGSDQMIIRVIGHKSQAGGVANMLFSVRHTGFDNGEAILPNALLHTFSGLSFTPDVSIVVGLAEDDVRIAPGLPQSGLGVANGGNPIAGLRAVLCEGDQGEDDCIGDPQILPITAADWNNAVVKKQVVTKTLLFQGDGGIYEVVFELRKS